MMTTFNVLIPNSSCHVIEVQKWMNEHEVKHLPTRKTEGGWIFRLYDEKEAMALKLRWR